MRSLSVHIALLVIVLAAAEARGQSFFGGGVVAFDPEISTAQSGVVTDVQANVSYDRKYVTFTIGAQQSDLLALRPFVVQQNNGAGQAMGFVGGVIPSQDTQGGTATVSNSPEEIDRRAVAARSLLSRRGMFLLRVN